MNSTPHLSTAGWRPSCLRVVAALCLCACPPPSLTASVPDFDPATATFDELFFNAQRYATTPERRERKELSRQELKARGADSLSFYVEHAGVDNSWYFMLADEEVSLLPPEVGVPVLLRELDSRQPKAAETAAFFLGRYDRPEYAARLLPLLDNEDTAGVAVRTLGHWKIRDAVPLIAGYLHHPKERRRIGAANALRHIADPRAAPSLIEALGDPVFTVRKAAARALVAIGKESEAPILKAFPGAARTPQREMMSSDRQESLNACPIVLSRSSPSLWPNTSLMSFRLLASPMMMERGNCLAVSSLFSSSSKNVLLYRPVSRSW